MDFLEAFKKDIVEMLCNKYDKETLADYFISEVIANEMLKSDLECCRMDKDKTFEINISLNSLLEVLLKRCLSENTE